jgi:hypothetical protein
MADLVHRQVAVVFVGGTPATLRRSNQAGPRRQS